jgi:hypothetical protein
MPDRYEWDIFISFAHSDAIDPVRAIAQRMINCGLRVFWSDRIGRAESPFSPQIQQAIANSQHFLLYWSKNAKDSDWVKKECEAFYSRYHVQDQKHRKIYILMDGGKKEDLFVFIEGYDFYETPDQLIIEVVTAALADSKEYCHQLEEQLGQARLLYRHDRFWGTIAHSQNKDVHIFTCARDIHSDSTAIRGQFGRTNLDMWDYRTVLDITHFFASNYPNVKVTIEDPTSKLRADDLANATSLAKRIGNMQRLLQDKNCIIVGSPDVSDFAEIVLAELHEIDPYTAERVKTRGFVVIKKQRSTNSSFYWKQGTGESEGIAQIIDDKYEYFPHEPATEKGKSGRGRAGKMYGILVAANNPFCEGGHPRRVIILSGFSGVATNAVVKILTDDRCLNEFLKLDQAYVNMDCPIEALIGVRYVVGKNSGVRDTRQIENPETAITFEKLVEI